MPTNRKVLGATAFSLALAGGGIAGVVLGGPAISSAQDGTTSTTSTDSTEPGDHWGPGPRGGAGLDVASEALGMTTDELATALRAGQSISQVADDQGVDVQTVIDAMVADAQTRLDDAASSLPDRITELVNRVGLPDHGDHGDHHGGRGHGPGLDVAAATIGVTEDELGTALQGGSSIADVAASHDVSTQKVIDAMVAQANEHIDGEVTEGDLTQAQADVRKAGAEAAITTLVNHKGPFVDRHMDGLTEGA